MVSNEVGYNNVGEPYFTVQKEGMGEFVISRSRFICRARPVSTEEDAISFIQRIRKEHWDATHNVWAYTVGAKRVKFSDDGEPQGTAGLPLLEVIRKEGLRDLVVVVTRYFGGVKLGAGGLVRAYTQGAKTAIEAGGIIQRSPYLSFNIVCEYAFSSILKKGFEKKGYILKDSTYADNVSFAVLVPPIEKEILYGMVAEITSGKGSILEAGLEYVES